MKNIMNIKHLTIAIIAGVTLTLGCKKALKPQMRGDNAEVEVKTLASNVPFGDEERIIIKPRVMFTSGKAAVGAEVKVEQNSFSTSGTVDAMNSLSLEVPALGAYTYNVIYKGNHVVKDQVFVDQPILLKNDVIK